MGVTSRNWGTRLSVVLGGATLLASLATAPSLAKQKEPPPDLTGTWKLNQELSESLQKKMDKMRASMGGGMGRGPGGMGGGMGGGAGGGIPGGSGGRRGGMGGAGGGREGRGGMDPSKSPAMASLAQPPLMLTVEQSDTELVLSERGRTLKTLALREAAEGDGAAGGVSDGVERMKARWKGKRLEAESASQDGRRLQETYSLGDDGQTLTVIASVDTPRGKLELKRVYDRYQGD